jgi:hypothetical protein
LAIVIIVSVALLAGCQTPPVDIDVPTSMPVDVDAYLDADVELAALDQQARADAPQSAGRDARQIVNTVNLSGSAWGIVAALAACLAVVVLWSRTAGGRREARLRERSAEFARQSADQARSRRELEALVMARAIKRLGPGPQRDRLLAAISGAHTAQTKDEFDRWLGQRGLFVCRKKDAGAAGGGGAAGNAVA